MSGQSGSSGLGVVAVYPTRQRAEDAVAALRSHENPPEDPELVTGAALRQLLSTGTDTDTAVLRGVGRWAALGALIGAALGAVIGLVVHQAVDSSSSLAGYEIVGVLVGLAVGALIGPFFGGMASLSRSRERTALQPTSTAVVVRTDDAEALARAVDRLAATSTDRLVRIGPSTA